MCSCFLRHVGLVDSVLLSGQSSSGWSPSVGYVISYIVSVHRQCCNPGMEQHPILVTRKQDKLQPDVSLGLYMYADLSFTLFSQRWMQSLFLCSSLFFIFCTSLFIRCKNYGVYNRQVYMYPEVFIQTGYIYKKWLPLKEKIDKINKNCCSYALNTKSLIKILSVAELLVWA